MTEVDPTIYSSRNEFSHDSLDVDQLATTPHEQFQRWLNDALEKKVREPNAFVLSTVDANYQPHARVLYIREFSDAGLVFYTNYASQKGRELDENNRAAITFFWAELERQVRISGKIEKVPSAQSDAYFNSRPRGSQIGAWASEQSTSIASRKVLEERVAEFTKQFEGKAVPRPPHWGGYLLVLDEVEFWQGRPSRLHDRVRYKQVDNAWEWKRLAP